MSLSHESPVAARRDLSAVVKDMLSDLTFMVCDGEAATPAPGAVWFECEIGYRGPFFGTLRCWCTRDLAIHLAANLLGLEPDESDAHAAAEDAVREFMNILCGHLVTSWYGTSSVFTLTIPALHACDGVPPPPTATDATYAEVAVSGERFCCVHLRRTGP